MDQRRRHALRPGRHRSRCGRAAEILCLALCAATFVAAPAGAASTGGRGQHSADTLADRLAGVHARLDRLYARADDRILDYADAAAELEQAEEDSRSADLAAERARDRTAETRKDAAAYAAAAYKGADTGPALAWSTAEGPQQALDRGADLALIGHRRSSAVGTAAAALSAAETLSERADAAEADRRTAAEEAARAEDDALEAVAEQEDALADLTAEQSAIQADLADLAGARGSGAGETGGAAEAGGAGGAGSGRAQGVCAPAAEAGPGTHPNGRIPAAALCPLPQSGQLLRPGAAAAFTALDGAFREHFGRPICVTDSYRPFSEQVRLFREKAAGKAASPGTSAHGSGTAVDLCGGINRNGSPEYRWMLRNAPGHGWHNPPWARGGFEPWHWEYTA
ncbi:hypothetical protein GCM10027570_26140 [Streptomonospora sediminis]